MSEDKTQLYSYTETENLRIYKFLGMKLSCRNAKFAKQEKDLQDYYDIDEIKNTKTLVIFLLPDKRSVNGGIQSIYSLCKYSRQILKDSCCVLATVPSKYTYSHIPYFKNDEKVYRWEQVIKNTNAENIIVHIPEFFAGKFYKSLKETEIKKLKETKDLQINILNQNILKMPEVAKLKDLYNLTKNITQTIAHNRYATQEMCNKYNMPVHLLSVHIDLSEYKPYNFEEKEKIIVLSPDYNENRDRIIKKIQLEMPDFKLITVKNMTFSEYMELISKAYFTITFGEGMDGYFLQPQIVGSMGFSVYNSEFFPNDNWKKFVQVYKSYDEMYEKITDDFKELLDNKMLYYGAIDEVINECKKIYNFDNWLDNIKRFYDKNYDYIMEI